MRTSSRTQLRAPAPVSTHPSSRFGTPVSWAWATTRPSTASSWSPRRRSRTSRRPPSSGSASPRPERSSVRPKRSWPPAGPTAPAAGCRWIPPAIPAPRPMARDRSPDRSNFPFADLESALRGWPIIDLLGLMPGSSNHTLLARMDGGDGDPFLAVYKPARGERPLWDFAAGTLYRREVAAYRLARHLGWPAIPPTVVRTEAPLGVGA